MRKEFKFLVDSEGFVRIEPVKIDLKVVEEIVEQVFVRTGINFVVKKLDIPFSEYDGHSGLGGGGGVKRRWTDDEERYVLLNCLDKSNDEMADAIGRSGMGVFMHKSDLQSEFDAFLRDNPETAKLSREKQVDAYIDDSYVDDGEDS
jgi:hypothetical protein